jgi:hypothetical protein
MKILHFIIFIAVHRSRIGSSYFYRGSGIPDPDPLIFITDPGSRILLFLPQIRDPGSSYFFADPGSRILLFYRGSIEDPNPDPVPANKFQIFQRNFQKSSKKFLKVPKKFRKVTKSLENFPKKVKNIKKFSKKFEKVQKIVQKASKKF